MLSENLKQELNNILESGNFKYLTQYGDIPKFGKKESNREFEVKLKFQNGQSDDSIRLFFDADEYEISDTLILNFTRIDFRPTAYRIKPKLKEGAAGDWHKEGYKIDNIGPADYEGADDGQAEEFFTANEHLRPYEFTATDPSGEPVAFARIGPTKDNKHIYTYDIEIEEPHRRKGIASEMYKMAEKFFGKKMKKGVSGLSKDSEALWGSDKRVFGETVGGYEIVYFDNHRKAGEFVDSTKHDFHQLFPSNLMNKSVYALKDGEIVGFIQFTTRDNNLIAIDAKVKEEHRRKGLASAMYDKAEIESGLKVIPSDNQTPDAKSFWKKRLSEAVGDWKSLGYKLDHRPLPENLFGKMGKKGMEVFVTNKKGKEIAHARAEVRRSKSTVFDVYVNPEDRRKGLATAMYQYIERQTGTKVQRSGDQTDQGKALWKHGQKSNGEKHFGEASLDDSDVESAISWFNELDDNDEFADEFTKKIDGADIKLVSPEYASKNFKRTHGSTFDSHPWPGRKGSKFDTSFVDPSIVVMFDGEFFVLDGQHRMNQRIKDDLDIPVVIIDGHWMEKFGVDRSSFGGKKIQSVVETKDPRKSGYSFTTKENSGNLVIKAWKDGVKVGEMECAPSSAEPGKILVLNVEVDKEHRRKGIATEIYKIAEKHFNMPFRKATQTKDGKKFRRSYDSNRKN